MLAASYRYINSLYPYLFLLLAGLVILCTVRIIRRLGTGGCVAYGYIGILVLCFFTFVSLPGFSWQALLSGPFPDSPQVRGTRLQYKII